MSLRSGELGVLLLATVPLFAQTASITGRVTDPSHAVVPGAAVLAKSVETGLESRAETNLNGYFNISSLPPRSYQVSVTKSGFRPIRETNLQLVVQQVARLDFTLAVGALTETVEVSARSVLLDSETSSLGHLVSGGQVVNLPLLGRNPYALAGLLPGVRITSTMNDLPVDQISTSYASINGQKGNQNEYLLDGAPNTSPAQNQPVLMANVDSVQEFKVETNSFSAEYGRASGGVFNVVTKSGTNDLHFTAYEFLRNDNLNANNFFANLGGKDKAPLRLNQFGGTIGMPVFLPRLYNGRNKTFFFGSAELVRYAQGVIFTATLPTAQQLSGDFTATRNTAGTMVAVYDPFSTRQSGTGYVRTPFSGNVIPQSQINPVARNIIKYFPAPNAPGNPVTGVNNYFRNGANDVQKNTFSTRVDHYFKDSNRFFTRFSYDNTPYNRAKTYGADTNATATAGPQIFARRNAVIEDNETFSPTMIGVLRYSYTRLSNQRRPYTDGFDITTLGFPAGLGKAMGDPLTFPAMSVTGLSVSSSVPQIIVGGILGTTDLIRLGTDTHVLMGQITKNFSKHVLKAGGEIRLIRANLLQRSEGSAFSFSNTWTQGPNPAQSSTTAGVGIASLLLGMAGGSCSPAPGWAQQHFYYAGYVQDTWKLTTRLTLNLGLRYDLESPRSDRFNQFTNFDFNAKPPLNTPGLDLHGVLTFPGTNSIPRTIGDPDKNNVAPRVGLAYKLNDKTVLRSGFGLFYTGTTGVGTGNSSFGISGFQTTTSIITSLDGVTPIGATLSNPYPKGILAATGSSLGPATLLGQTVYAANRGFKVPYAVQWNFDIQRQLPGSVVLDVGYAGSHGVDYNIDATMNQLTADQLKLGDALRQQVTNPFYGQISSGILASATVARAQLLRPYPQFDSFNFVFTNGSSSVYHALQAKVEKRYAHGFTVTGSYA